jgi:glycine oxidase
VIEKDYIIVGQGLAGSAVAWQLLQAKKQFVVFDDAQSNYTSRIAAGLFNPVTGKKMVKTWMADLLFPCLHEFYSKIQQHTGVDFFFPGPLYRPFVSIEEQNEWMARSADSEYSAYIDRVFTTPTFEHIRDPFGGLLLKQGGFLRTTEFIRAMNILIRKHDSLLPGRFDPERLRPADGVVEYEQYRAKALIFCSGVHNNKWFDWLPIRPLKGETITIRNNFHENVVVNRGVYMVPSNQAGVWRVGATYDFHDRSPEITSKARKELETGVRALFDGPFETCDHQFGFRPTTPDRRPMLGCHPEHRSLVIFNGLGTKGVSLAPYFSEVLVHWLENGSALQKEVDIKRYKSVYWDSPE